MAFTIGRTEVRLAMHATGGDLRAVGAMLGLSTEEILTILAYDVTLTRMTAKTADELTGVAAIPERRTQP
jgi:hypothetical protein